MDLMSPQEQGWPDRRRRLQRHLVDAQLMQTFLLPDVTWDQATRAVATHPAARAALADECAALRRIPFGSVTDKATTAPSGSPHDFLSIAPYWWPNPDTSDGLPWVRRDGEVNPSSRNYDNTRIDAMYEAVATAIVAHRATGGDEEARFAGRYLTHWFLDPATRMNPNLEHAQAIPGATQGRGLGVIDTVSLIYLLDAVAHLRPGSQWSADDLDGLRQWFSDYLDWLLTSENGRAECAEPNNHEIGRAHV